MTLFQADILTTLLTKHINNQNKTENQIWTPWEILWIWLIFQSNESRACSFVQMGSLKWGFDLFSWCLVFSPSSRTSWENAISFGTIATLYRGSISIHFFYLFRETKLSHCEQFNLWRRACLFMQIHKLGKYFYIWLHYEKGYYI